MLRVWARSFFRQILYPNVIGTQGLRRCSETRLLFKHEDMSSHPALTLGKADIMEYTYNLSIREVGQEQSHSSGPASAATPYSVLEGEEPSASSQLHSQPSHTVQWASCLLRDPGSTEKIEKNLRNHLTSTPGFHTHENICMFPSSICIYVFMATQYMNIRQHKSYLCNINNIAAILIAIEHWVFIVLQEVIFLLISISWMIITSRWILSVSHILVICYFFSPSNNLNHFDWTIEFKWKIFFWPSKLLISQLNHSLGLEWWKAVSAYQRHFGDGVSR